MKKKGFNDYIIYENYAEVIIKRRNGEIVRTLVDKEDIPKLIKLDYRWGVQWDPVIKNFYCQTNIYYRDELNKKKVKIQKLNRLIMDCFGPEVVDHINNNTLDNRKENLRTVQHKYNTTNRSGRNKNNTSGYRNVTLSNNKWTVQMQVQGKNKVLGYFEDLEDAGAFAEEMRLKYYGEFAGKN